MLSIYMLVRVGICICVCTFTLKKFNLFRTATDYCRYANNVCLNYDGHIITSNFK